MEENAIGMPDSFFERLNKKNGFADDTTAAPVDSGTTPVATDKTIPSGMPDSFFEKLNSQQHYADTNNWAENYKRYIPQAEENPSAWDNIKNNFFAIKDASEASMYGGLELMSQQGEKSGNANFANFIKAAGMYYGADPNWLVKNMQENEAQSQEELKRVWLDPKMGQFNATDMFADPKSFFQTQLPQMLGGSATLMAAGMGIAKGVQTGVMALGAAGAPFTFGGSAVAAGFIGGAVASAISRPIESLMEGYGAFDEAYSELAKKYPNATHQQLTDMAMPVFNKTFDENMQLQVLDAVQIGLSIIPVTAWGKGSLSGTGAIGRMARRADMMRQRYNVAAHIGETAFQMGTGGWEEGRQMQKTNEAINKYVGTDKPTSWYDMLNTKEGQSAVSGGAFMGGMMESPGILKLAYNKLTGVGDDIKTKPYEDIKQKQTALFYGNIAKSVNEGTTNEMMQAINKFGRSGVLATVETDDADSRNKSSIAEAKRLGDEVAEQVGVFSRMKEQYPDVSEKGLVRMFQNNALIRNNANALKTLSEDNVTDAPIIQRINAQNEALNKENNDIIAGKDVWETPSHEDPFADPEKDKEADIPFDSVEEVEAARLKEIEALQQIPTDGMTDEQMHQRTESLAEINSRYEDLKNRLTEKINDAKGHYENQRVLTEMLQNNIPVEGTIQKAYGMHYDFVTQDGKTVRFYNQATHDVVDDNDFNGSAFLVLRKAEQGLDGTYKDEKGNYLFRSVLGDKDHAERIEVHTTDKDGNDKYLGNVAVSNAEDYNIARDRAKAARMEKLEGEDGEGEGFSVSDEQLSGVKTTSNEQAAEAQSYGFRNAYHALNSVNKYFDADYTDYANIPKEDLALVGRIKQEEAASATTTTPPPDSPPPSEPDTPPAPPTPPPTPPPAPRSPSPATAPSGTTSSTDSGNAGYERTERSFDKVNVGDNITHNGKQGKVFAKVRPKGSLSHPVVLAKDAEGKVFRVTESEYKGTKEGDGDNVLKTNGKLVSYRNDVGKIVVDEENNVIFEGNKSSVELGKTTDEEFAAKSIGDIGISYVNENSLNQAILVDNTVYVKGEEQELVRINYDKNGNVVSYTYKNSKGQERTNRNYEAALDVAIQKNNQEFDKSRKGASDEVKQRDEEHISGVVKAEYGDSIGYILETMPDEVYDTFDLMESGVTSLEKDAIQYMVLRTIEALADARKRIEGSNATKKEKGSALSMIEKFEKDLNKYYGKLDQQGKVSAKDVAKANTRENNKGDGAVQDAEQKTEAYHADKAAGKETESVKAVEDLINKNESNRNTTTEVNPKAGVSSNSNEGNTALRDVESEKKQIEDFGVAKEDVEATHGLLGRVFDGLKKAGLTAAKNVGEWVGIGKGTEKPYSLKIDGKDTQVKNVQPEVVNGFYSPLEKIINESKSDKLPAKQWADKFAKGEEAKWTGLTDWLNQQQGSVSKADIQQYLKDNRIQVVEVVKGEDKIGKITRGGWREGTPNFQGRKTYKQGDYTIEPIPFGGGFQLIFEDGSDFGKKIGTYDDLNDAKDAANEENLRILGATSGTKFSQYQLEGEKENYKEVLVTLPQSKQQKEINRLAEKYGVSNTYTALRESNATDSELEFVRSLKNDQFKSSHFDEPNILVHLRMNTRIDAEGNRVLFLEEVQSDWGQKGKKEGFNEPIDFKRVETDKYKGYTAEVKGKTLSIAEMPNGKFNTTIDGNYNGSFNTLQEAKNNLSTLRDTAIPQAPFVTDTNAWTKLGLKVALKEAVKQGADKIAWTTGEQQNERYDLSKQVDGVEYQPQRDGKYDVFAHKDDNNIFYEKGIDLKRIADVFGKDVADKISKNEGTRATYDPNKFFKRLEGQDLKVGGKGMKGFYGSPTEGSLGIVGNVAKSLFKQEPKTVNIEGKKDFKNEERIKYLQHFVDELPQLEKIVSENKLSFTEQELDEAIGKGIITNESYKQGIKQLKKYEESVSKYNEYKERVDEYNKLKFGTTQHSIDITPEMRKQVETEGQPLFKKEDITDKPLSNFTIGNVMNQQQIKDLNITYTQKPMIIKGFRNPFDIKNIGQKAQSIIIPKEWVTNKFTSKLKGTLFDTNNEIYTIDIPTSEYVRLKSIPNELLDKVETINGAKLFKDAEAQYRVESGKNIIEAIKDFDGSPRATVALTHEIMHPTVVAIIDGAKEGNEVGAKHTATIVNEFNKANPNSKVTIEDLIKGNDAFKDGTTSKQYRAVQEFIAEAWEKYHREGGKGFSEAFQKVLEQITQAFKQVYKSLTGKELTPELRNMFDEILGKEEVKAEQPTVSGKEEGSGVGGDVDITKPKVGKYDGDTDFEIRTTDELNVDDVLKRDKPIKLYPEQIVPINPPYSDKAAYWVAPKDIVINEGYGSIDISKGDKIYISVSNPQNGGAESSTSYKVWIKNRSYPLSHFIPETAEHGTLDESKYFDAVTQMKNFDKVISGELETPQKAKEERIKIAEKLIPNKDFYVSKPYNSKSGFEHPKKIVYKNGKYLRLRDDHWVTKSEYEKETQSKQPNFNENEYNIWGEYNDKNALAWDIVNNARLIHSELTPKEDLSKLWDKQYDYLTSENKKRYREQSLPAQEAKAEQTTVLGKTIESKPTVISNKKESFKITTPDRSTKDVTGQSVSLLGYEGLDLFVHREDGKNGDFVLTEKRTGLEIGRGNTAKDAADKAIATLKWQQAYNKEYPSIYEQVNGHIKKSGTIDGSGEYENIEIPKLTNSEKIKILESKKTEQEQDIEQERKKASKYFSTLNVEFQQEFIRRIEKRIEELKSLPTQEAKAEQPTVSETPPALRDVESTAKALEEVNEVSHKPLEDIGEKLYQPKYVDENTARDVIESFTHYKSGSNKYPATKWARWFQSVDANAKKDIVDDIKNNPELRNSMLSLLYDLYKKEIGFDGSFEDFILTPIKLFRGVTDADKKGKGQEGFSAYSISKNRVSGYAHNRSSNNPEVKEVTVRPIDTYGAVNYIMGAEVEVLLPQNLSKETLQKEFNRLVELNIGEFSENQRKKLEEYYTNDDYIGGVQYAKSIINGSHKTISEAYHKAKADGSNPELVKAVEELLDKPKETSPTPNSKGEGTEVKYQIEESRDEPLASVNPALAEYIRQRMQRLFPSVALFSDKASFEAAAKKVSKGVTFSSAYIGAAIKNMVYVDAEKALQHTEIHEYAHIYWDALPADHPLKTALLDKFGGNEEAAIDAIGRAGTIIMENELDIAKSGFFEKWLKKFWAAVKGVFTSKSIEQAFAERLLTNADEVTEENITSGVVKYMKMKSSAKYSELSEKAVKGIEKIIGKKISSLTFPEYYKHISTEIKPNDFKQWKMLSPQKFLEKMYGIVSPVSTLSPSNKAVFMKQYREYLDDYNWAENNVWTRFASGSMTLTVKEIEDLYMEAYKRKSYGTKDAVNFLADLYSKAVMYKNMQQEIKGDTFNKPFAKMSFDMMSGHEITDLSGSEFVSGKYSLLSPDRVKETILQGREKLYREVQRNATIKEDALKNDFDAIWKRVKDLKSDLRKIVDKTGTYFIDRNSSAYKALRGGTAADRALADLLDMHYKYESAYGGLSMEKGKYRVPVARMDFGGLAKKFGFKEGMRRYFAKPSKYDNVIIDVRSLGLSKPLMTLKQARQEMVKGSNAIYPFQMLKLTKKVDALTKEAYKQFNSGRHANGDIVTTEDLSGSRYGVSFVKDDESSEDLKVSMMLYHYANIENESYDLLSPYSMYIQKYLGRKDKPNMLKWVKMLDDDLIKGESPTSNLGVYAKYVQALTNYTHWLQLGFNIAGMPFNAFAGFAQSVREIGFRNTLKGLRRVIGSLTVGGGAGVVNAKAISIMEKLHIVSLSKDLEMSVTSKIGKGISKIAFLPVSFVEYINHAYSFIGAMDESEWERVKALPANASAEDYTKAMGGNERIDELHTLTQKINGAYSKYSRRGINKTAEGRALMQFKNWLPDVIFAHLTVSQLNEAGEDLYGEYQSGIATSIKNTVWNKTIIPMFKDKSIAQAKKNWETLSEHERMQVGKAMRQLVILGGMALWIASLDDRDDKELKRMLKRAMGDVTYIFDVSNMQFLFDNTVPVFGTIKNLLGLVAEVFSTATGNPSVYEKRQGSHMRGDLKLPVMIENQTPVVNKISKLVNEGD